MKRLLVVCVTAVMLFSCTDATVANLGSYGRRHKITMYNGGKLVREWMSTGKVTSISNSDGWQFMDSKTNKLVRVGGDVIIEVVN
jgi:hypothetical protein